MLSNRIDQLAPPPRRVPLHVACRTMMGLAGGIGAIMIITSLTAVWILAGDYRPIADLQLALSPETVTGTITRVTQTNSSENDVTVYRYEFTFSTPDEKVYTGQSYVAGQPWSVEERVTVRYLPQDPAISTIEGARRTMLPVWILPVLLIFPGIGVGMFISSSTNGWRQVRLLRHGEIAGADIISEHATGTEINDVPVMAYVYEFPARDGETYMGRSKALPSGRIGDEAKEPVLYLPWNPRRSTLVDTLPLRYPLDVDAFGQWSTPSSIWPVIGYTMIWIGILGHAGYALARVALGLLRQ